MCSWGLQIRNVSLLRGRTAVHRFRFCLYGQKPGKDRMKPRSAAEQVEGLAYVLPPAQTDQVLLSAVKKRSTRSIKGSSPHPGSARAGPRGWGGAWPCHPSHCLSLGRVCSHGCLRRHCLRDQKLAPHCSLKTVLYCGAETSSFLAYCYFISQLFEKLFFPLSPLQTAWHTMAPLFCLKQHLAHTTPPACSNSH